MLRKNEKKMTNVIKNFKDYLQNFKAIFIPAQYVFPITRFCYPIRTIALNYYIIRKAALPP